MNQELQTQTDLLLKALHDLDAGQELIFYLLCFISLLLLIKVVIALSKK